MASQETIVKESIALREKMSGEAKEKLILTISDVLIGCDKANQENDELKFLVDGWIGINTIFKQIGVEELEGEEDVASLLTIDFDGKNGRGYKVKSWIMGRWVEYFTESWESVTKRNLISSIYLDARGGLVEDIHLEVDRPTDSVALTVAVLKELGEPVDEATQLGLFAVAHLSKAMTLFEEEATWGIPKDVNYDPCFHILKASRLLSALSKNMRV